MKKYKILFISSEVYPFAKTDILADFSYQLPLALSNLGNEVRVIMPKYKSINERKYVLREVIRLKDIEISVGEERKTINVKSAFMPDSKVQIYFIDYKPFFNREGLYIDKKMKKKYLDNDDRFILFSKGVLETLKLLFWQPDIIHCNDWFTGLIPLYIKTIYKDDKFFKKTSTIFTVHNFIETGCFSKTLHKKRLFTKIQNYDEKQTELDSKFSFLKAGISFSDYLCTDNNHYLQGIKKVSEVSSELNDVLKKKKDKISCITKGTDYSIWNPEVDKLINNQYNIKSIDIKVENKKQLLKKAGLPFQDDVPVIGWVYNKYDSLFLKIINDIAKELENLKIQILFVGKFRRKNHAVLSKYNKQYFKNFNFIPVDDDKSLHNIIAGCDVLLLPYLYYQSELNPFNSLKYGTVPIVRNIGEFSDIVVNYSSKERSGNGLLLSDYNSTEILKRLNKVAKLFRDQEKWKILQKNCMKENFLWKNSAKKYMKLYSTATKK